MVDNRELIQFFSEFWGIDPTKINDNLALDSAHLKGQTSIKIYQFFAEVESKFGVKINNINKVLTFGDLIKNIT